MTLIISIIQIQLHRTSRCLSHVKLSNGITEYPTHLAHVCQRTIHVSHTEHEVEKCRISGLVHVRLLSLCRYFRSVPILAGFHFSLSFPPFSHDSEIAEEMIGADIIISRLIRLGSSVSRIGCRQHAPEDTRVGQHKTRVCCQVCCVDGSFRTCKHSTGSSRSLHNRACRHVHF